MTTGVRQATRSHALGDAQARLAPLPLAGQKLRISLTASCNYSCFFCHNEGALPERPGADQLTPDDLALVVGAAARAGFRSIKLTGGEPLLYRSGAATVIDAVKTICKVVDSSSVDLSMTTNGQLLQRSAPALAAAGLPRVTVSMHTLDTNTFRRDISASGSPDAQLRGIDAAVANGIHVKANVLILAENSHEVPSLVRRLHDAGVQDVRFYRLLWTPLLGDRFEHSRIADHDMVTLAASVLGASPSARELDWAVAALDGTCSDPTLRTLAITRKGRTITLDAMPRLLGAWDGSEEGDYAVRVGARAELRVRLFELEEDLRPLFRDRSGDALVERLAAAQRSLAT